MNKRFEELKKYTENATVLFVENDKENRRAFEAILFPLFSAFFAVDNQDEAYSLYSVLSSQTPVDLVIIDLSIGENSSIDLIRKIKEIHKEQQIILLARENDGKVFVEAIEAGVENYLVGAFDESKLYEILQKSLLASKDVVKNLEYQHQLEEKVARQDSFIENIVGKDQDTGMENEYSMSMYLESNSAKISMLVCKILNLVNIKTYVGKNFSDGYIVEFSHLLRTFFENGSKSAHLYRIDYDELVIVLECDLDYASKIAQEISTVARFFFTVIDGITLNSNLQVGLFCGNENVFSNAKLALTKASSCGDDFYVLNEEDLENEFNHSQNVYWLHRFTDAIENDSLMPFFQPIIKVASGQVHAYESLARISELGEVAGPDKFMEIANKVRLVPFLTKIIIKKTFEYFSGRENMRFNINLSSQDLHDSSIMKYIHYWQEKLHIEPSMITFEITQSDDVYNKNLLKESIYSLKNSGFKLALDDFGVGSSNVMTLCQYKFDYIKIDGKLIQKLRVDDSKMIDTISYLDKIIKLSGAKSIAEGVEDNKTQSIIKNIGIDYAQGYAIAKAGSDANFMLKE